MPDKKKNHYVPCFYLKLFASDRGTKEPRTICLYNIPRQLLIQVAGLVDQCAEDRFYGASHNLEDAMSTLESAWASLFRDFCDNATVPRQRPKNHLLLLLFISIQMLRTKRQALETNESIRMMIKTLVAHDSTLAAGGHDDFDWELSNPVFLSLQSFLAVAYHLDDLKMCLIQANPPNAFVTSDNPVFKYNLYCEGCTEGGTVGAANTGLLVFLPVSPKFSLLLYDGGVYKVGRLGNRELMPATSADVNALNGLQYVGADSNLYFSGGFTADYFEQLSAIYGRAHQEIGFRAIEAEEVGSPGNILIHEYRHTPNMHLSLSFLSIRRQARRVPLALRIRSYRREIEVAGSDPGLGSKARKYVPIRRSGGRLGANR